MHRTTRVLPVALVGLLLVALLAAGRPQASFAAQSSSMQQSERSHVGFNDEYLFPATRGLNDMDVHPALKLPLMPVTIILDTLLLPFSLIAGFITSS